MAFIFTPGSAKTAKAPVSVQPSGYPCTAVLWLSTNKTQVAVSSTVAFTSAGTTQQITFVLNMPTAYGEYFVLIDVFMQGVFIVGMEATDKIIIPTGTVGPPVWT